MHEPCSITVSRFLDRYLDPRHCSDHASLSFITLAFPGIHRRFLANLALDDRDFNCLLGSNRHVPYREPLESLDRLQGKFYPKCNCLTPCLDDDPVFLFDIFLDLVNEFHVFPDVDDHVLVTKLIAEIFDQNQDGFPLTCIGSTSIDYSRSILYIYFSRDFVHQLVLSKKFSCKMKNNCTKRANIFYLRE